MYDAIAVVCFHCFVLNVLVTKITANNQLILIIVYIGAFQPILCVHVVYVVCFSLSNVFDLIKTLAIKRRDSYTA